MAKTYIEINENNQSVVLEINDGLNSPKQIGLGDLSDVDFSTEPLLNQILRFNGKNFIPSYQDENSGNEWSQDDEIFQIERDNDGNIVKVVSLYNMQFPPLSIELGNAIKQSDLGQSLSYSTKFDGKEYIVLGYEISNSGSRRPFVKKLESPTSFDIQPFFDEQETYNTQQSFPIISLQDVIGKTYKLKAFTESNIFRIRLIRKATNGGEDTIIVDETLDGSITNIDGFEFDLTPITDFTINTNYELILSVDDGDVFDVLGSSSITGSFLPYIRREIGWEYTFKDLAYLDDLSDFVSSSEKGEPNGVVPLNSDGKIDPNYLYDVGVDDIIDVIGVWNANTNDPDISQLTLQDGQALRVIEEGNTTINGYTGWQVGDLALWLDSLSGNWFRMVSSNKVLDVNGQRGHVVINKDDVGLNQVDNTADIDKELSNASINALANKVNLGGNITELNNDAGYINSILVDNETIIGNGIDVPLSSTGSQNSQDSLIIKTNILSNVPVTQALNSLASLDCFGSLNFSTGSGWSFSENGITIPSNGFYAISVRVGFISTGIRSCPVLGLSLNGESTGDESNYAYIRNSQDLNESACVLSTTLELKSGDVIGLMAKRAGSVSEPIYTYDVGSSFSIEKIAGEKTSSGVSSIGDLSDVDITTKPPEINQVLKFNGINFVPEDGGNGSSGGGNVVVLDKEVIINEGFWNENQNYLYPNISIPEVKRGQLCIIYPSPQIWQTIQANNGSWQGYAYCNNDGLVTAVCRVDKYIGVSPLSTFSIKIVEPISTFSSLFKEPLKQEIDIYSENISVNKDDHDKHFNIMSPMNYTVTLPPLDDVDMSHIYKFKNLNDSTLSGTFIPVFGEKIENLTHFDLYGRGTLSIRKKYDNNGSKWAIIEISNLFDHVGQGKSKEVPFNNHFGNLEIIHERGYKPIVKVYTEDGFGSFSESEVDIDHNDNMNSFIVNLEGVNTGFIRYI